MKDIHSTKFLNNNQRLWRNILPLGATNAQARNICDFPKPGSPTTNTCDCALCTASFSDPPNNANNKPALTISWPKIVGHNDWTSNLKRFSCKYSC